jgi:pimeloyl-ACP methyl ester carboxylesterase
MKRIWVMLLAMVLVLALAAPALAASNTVAYISRGVQVHADVVLPEGDGPFPLVVMCHGHGGSRDENIGFSSIANALALKGVASIRMDFPGCGKSGESFQNNNLTNMKADVQAALDYALKNYPIDSERVGIFGYSMGGRIALELLAAGDAPYKAVGLLAPAASTEALKPVFGGSDNWDKLKAEAEENGFAAFTTIYGQEQELGKQFFADLEAVPDPTEAAAAAFKGKALVIYAEDDTVVPPADVSQKVADALGAEVIKATGDDHGYGFYSDKTDVLNIVVNGVSDFFSKSL